MLFPEIRPGQNPPTRNYSDAPTTIASKVIVDFSTNFCNYSRLMGDLEFICMHVNREDGHMMLHFKSHTVEVNTSFLEMVQEIIDKNKLVSCNGKYEYVCGLPPEAQPYSLNAIYDSGEKLSFAICTSPEADWCRELRSLLCQELVRHGIEDLLPPKCDRKLVRFDLSFNEWPRKVEYGTISTGHEEDERRPVHYMKSVWNYETDDTESFDTYKIPDGFYEHVSELVEQTNLRDYSNGNIDWPSTRRGQAPIDKHRTPVIKFCAEGESGRQFNTFIYGEDIPDGLREAAGIIRRYLERVLSELEPIEEECSDDPEESSLTETLEALPRKTEAAAEPSNTWLCPSCGHSNFHNFCSECGTPKV